MISPRDVKKIQLIERAYWERQFFTGLQDAHDFHDNPENRVIL
jgi:hypothetical protein